MGVLAGFGSIASGLIKGLGFGSLTRAITPKIKKPKRIDVPEAKINITKTAETIGRPAAERLDDLFDAGNGGRGLGFEQLGSRPGLNIPRL